MQILVNREANLYFFKLALFRPYLASAWLKNNRKTWRLAEEINRSIDQSAVVKEFAGEFESFVLSTIEKYHNVRSSTYDPSEHK